MGTFLQVVENQENDCLCFQLCFAELNDYKGKSEKLFELILAFQCGFWHVLYQGVLKNSWMIPIMNHYHGS